MQENSTFINYKFGFKSMYLRMLEPALKDTTSLSFTLNSLESHSIKYVLCGGLRSRDVMVYKKQKKDTHTVHNGDIYPTWEVT
jgi:hypothetical protein